MVEFDKRCAGRLVLCIGAWLLYLDTRHKSLLRLHRGAQDGYLTAKRLGHLTVRIIKTVKHRGRGSDN